MASKRTRLQNGDIVFEDYPEFRPNLTPAEIMEEVLSVFIGGLLKVV